jgi:hypothetical protein
MRRIVGLVVLLAGAFVVAPPAANAITYTTVVSTTGLPTAIKVVHVPCPEASPPAVGTSSTGYSHTFGASFPPMGHGSLRVGAVANQLSGLQISSTAPLADLNVLMVSLDSELGRVHAEVFPSGSSWVLSKESQKFVSGWPTTLHDLLSGTGWTWTNGGMPEGPGTIADFVAAHPPSSAGFKVELLSGACAVISTLPSYWDDLRFGLSGHTPTRYNFESTTGGLTISANHSTIAVGSTVTLSTVFRDGGTLQGGRNVELWAKKSGALHYVRIRMLTTVVTAGPSFGHASATVKPAVTTSYQWRHPLDAAIQATSSPVKVVHVTQ